MVYFGEVSNVYGDSRYKWKIKTCSAQWGENDSILFNRSERAREKADVRRRMLSYKNYKV